jgi:pilus assembly protein Flp/PilA
MELIRKNLRELMTDTRGVTAVEYGLMAALIATALVAIVGTLTGALQAAFTKISTEMPQ